MGQVREAAEAAEGKGKGHGKGKGKGKGKDNSPWALTSWARGWRLRMLEVLPHGDDECMSFDAAPLRSLVLELWDEVAKRANGDAEAALALFATEEPKDGETHRA